MITDEQLTRKLANQIDLSNQAGWDQKPSLGVVIVDTSTRELNIADMPVTDWGDPGEKLNLIARAISSDPATATMWANPDAKPGLMFYGFLFESESWTLLDQADIIERMRPGGYRRIMDFPSATEARTLTYCDITGRLLQVIHARKTGENTILSAADEQHVVGRVPRAMVTLVKVVASRMPERTADFKALNKLIRLVNQNEETIVAKATGNQPA